MTTPESAQEAPLPAQGAKVREEPSSSTDAISPNAPSKRAAALPGRIAEMIESFTANIQRRSLGPLELASRAIALFIVASAMILLVLALLAIGLVRLLDAYLFPDTVWASYALIGGLFIVGGVLAHFKASSLKTRTRLYSGDRLD